MKVEKNENLEQEQIELSAITITLEMIKQLADKCRTIEEFRIALAEIIAKQ